MNSKAPGRIAGSKDLWSGLVFIGFGLLAMALSRGYAMGHAGRMGPGYFPTVLSILLVLIGLGVLAASLRSREVFSGFAYRGFASVVLGTIAFGVLIRGAGIIVAVMALVLICATGNPKSRWLPMLGLAIGMAAFSWLVFVKALGLPIPVIGPWLS